MGDFHTRTAQDLVTDLPKHEWRRLPAGEGSKGPRLYDWALWLMRLQSPPWDHWLLIRRSIADPTDMAFYVTFGPHTTELQELAAVAGLRWTIEECFQSAKGEAGFDHCEARSWHGWHRHMTLSMLALAFLAGLRARLKETQIEIASGKANKVIRRRVAKTATIVAISVQELRRLIAHLHNARPADMSFHWAWSIWRRRHQAQAKRAHYRKRRIGLTTVVLGADRNCG